MGKRYLKTTPSTATYHLNKCTKKQRPGPNSHYYPPTVEHLVPGPGLSTLYALPPLILTLLYFIEEKSKGQRC